MDIENLLAAMAEVGREAGDAEETPPPTVEKQVALLDAFYDGFMSVERGAFDQGDLLVLTGAAPWVFIPAGTVVMFEAYTDHPIYGYNAAGAPRDLGTPSAGLIYDCITYTAYDGEVTPFLMDSRHLRRPTEAEIASYRAAAA